MKTSVNSYDFERAFVTAGRCDQFTYAGKKALFEYLEQYEEDSGSEIELDVVALCCEYTEYDCAQDACKYYNYDPAIDDEDEDEHDRLCIDWLQNQTCVIEYDGGIIICNF